MQLHLIFFSYVTFKYMKGKSLQTILNENQQFSHVKNIFRNAIFLCDFERLLLLKSIQY